MCAQINLTHTSQVHQFPQDGLNEKSWRNCESFWEHTAVTTHSRETSSWPSARGKPLTQAQQTRWEREDMRDIIKHTCDMSVCVYALTHKLLLHKHLLISHACVWGWWCHACLLSLSQRVCCSVVLCFRQWFSTHAHARARARARARAHAHAHTHDSLSSVWFHFITN